MIPPLRLNIDPAIAVTLGKAPEGLAAMTCGEFAELCFDKGLEVGVSMLRLQAGDPPTLNIQFVPDLVATAA